MTKKHIANKVFAEFRAELDDDHQRMVQQICDVHGYDLSDMTKTDIVFKTIELAHRNNGVETPSKEEWLKSIQNSAPYEDIDQVIVSEIRENCHFHAEENSQWYCEDKKIPCVVCVKQFKRFRAMKRRCHPLHRPRFRINNKMMVMTSNQVVVENTQPQGYRCNLKGQIFKKLEELPCLIDPMMSCPNKKCEEDILSRIKR